MNIYEEITSATDRKQFTIGVFIDLKKAFDTLNHNILISKLSSYGIRGVVLDWLRSYLENRKQYLQLSNIKSDLKKIECGVPQGSVLGPKLFLLYINDICDVSTILQFVLFADDTNLFCSGNDLKKLTESIGSEMIKLKTWFDVNKLSLNVKKTKFMIFGNRKKDENIVLTIQGVKIEKVTEFRFLGVILDDKLSWKPQIEHVKKKLTKSIFIMNKVKEVLNYEAMRTLYSALISPYLSYCLEMWGNAYKVNLNPIITLQKKALRIVHKAQYLEHTAELFSKSRILTLTELVKLQTLQVMFKAKWNKLPEKLQCLFQLESQFSRRKNNFRPPFARLTQKQMCPSVIGVKLWNSLNEELKGCKNICQFKISSENTYSIRIDSEITCL